MPENLLSNTGYNPRPLQKIKIADITNWYSVSGGYYTFDVKSVLPDLYAKLTEINFIMEDRQIYCQHSYGEFDDRRYLDVYPLKYDPSTGILKYSQAYGYAGKAGEGQSFAGITKRELYVIY